MTVGLSHAPRHNIEIQNVLVSKRRVLLSWKVVNRYNLSSYYPPINIAVTSKQLYLLEFILDIFFLLKKLIQNLTLAKTYCVEIF